MSEIGSNTSPEVPVYNPRLEMQEDIETYHFIHDGECLGLIEQSWQGWFAISGDVEVFCRTEDEAQQVLIDIQREV